MNNQIKEAVRYQELKDAREAIEEAGFYKEYFKFYKNKQARGKLRFKIYLLGYFGLEEKEADQIIKALKKRGYEYFETRPEVNRPKGVSIIFGKE